MPHTRLRSFVLAMTWLLLMGLSQPALADAVPVIPAIAGRTILHSEGVTGIVMHVPKAVTIDARDIAIATEGSFAYFMIAQRDCGWARSCFWRKASGHVLKDIGSVDVTTSSDDPEPLNPGPVEIYLASNGPLTLSMSFKGISGSQDLLATGKVEGWLERIPVTCPDPATGCDQFGYGGMVHEIGLAGYAWAHVFAFVNVPPPYRTASIRSVVACAYPGWTVESEPADPERHPTGCDLVPDSGSEEDLINVANNAIGLFSGVMTGGHSIGNGDANGPVYLGFTARKHTVPGVGSIGAYGVWLNAQIDCPSGDFLSC